MIKMENLLILTKNQFRQIKKDGILTKEIK